MARKKKKKREIAPRATEQAQVKTQIELKKELQPGERNTAKTIAQTEAPASRGTARGRAQVSLFVCVAGMLLTLVLGVYLGTLLPGVALDLSGDKSGRAKERDISEGQIPAKPEPQESKAARDESPQPANKLMARIAQLEKEVANASGKAGAWTELGNLYFDVGQPQNAIKAYEQSLALEPDNPDVLTDLGIMYRETENFQAAVKCFRKASAINPEHQQSLFNEGIVLSTDLHNNKEAAEAWTRLLGINPSFVAPNGIPVAEMLKKLR